ncbi:MAG: hypothetical protein P8185_24045, partial [Deltaproteobacteria bacterium]
MAVVFQAKDIQRVLEIKKIRYQYLSGKIGIFPEIEEVEGTGRSHIYSLKNLLEFAFANLANNLGLSPRSTRLMLEFLDLLNEPNKGIYSHRSQFVGKLFYLAHGAARYFHFDQLIFPVEHFKEIINVLKVGMYLNKNAKIDSNRFANEVLEKLTIRNHPAIKTFSSNIFTFAELNYFYPDKRGCHDLLSDVDGYI